jgi:hypothetical protein
MCTSSSVPSMPPTSTRVFRSRSCTKRKSHNQMPNADPAEPTETLAAVLCVECGRLRAGDELWCVRFADIGEIAIYCPECAEREFGGD